MERPSRAAIVLKYEWTYCYKRPKSAFCGHVEPDCRTVIESPAWLWSVIPSDADLRTACVYEYTP